MDGAITHIGERTTIPPGPIRPVPRRGEGGRAFDPDGSGGQGAATGREPETEESEVERPQLGERDEDEAGGLLDLTA